MRRQHYVLAYATCATSATRWLHNYYLKGNPALCWLATVYRAAKGDSHESRKEEKPNASTRNKAENEDGRNGKRPKLRAIRPKIQGVRLHFNFSNAPIYNC
jgi:hypothetical protein